MIVADTNVVSEFMKADPEPAVLAWAEALDAADLTICVVTVEEIERGLGGLPAGRRRRELEERWHALVGALAETVAVYDLAAAQATARILVDAEADGRPMTLADAQIAAYAPPGDGRSPPATSGSSSGWLAWLWSTRSSRSPAPPPAWRRGQSVAVLAEAVPAPGTWTVTAKATDLVGNVGSAAVDYTVEPWDLRGFQAPVKPGVVVSVETDDGSSLSAEFKLK